MIYGMCENQKGKLKATLGSCDELIVENGFVYFRKEA